MSMIKRILLILFPVIFIGAGKNEPVRIMAVGDSITQGGKRDKQEYTYRLPLQKLLHKNKIDYDFIGSRQRGLHEDAEWPDVANGVPFDPDHEGYYGNKTKDVCRKVMEAFPSYETIPDIVLIHLGTNDQKHGDYEINVGEPLENFISFIRKQNPRVVILLGHLNFNGGKPAMSIRTVVEDLANKMNTRKSPVQTVHHYINWIENPDRVYTDTFDWAHPNLKGQEKMALKWFEAMKTFLE